MGNQSVSAKIHARLNHPVIDADGHWIEFEPTLLDYLDGVAGPSMVDRFRRDDSLATGGHRYSQIRAPASSPMAAA